MSNRAFVLDANEQPLMPCHPARARELLDGGKAAVYRRFPFTIILKDREGGEVQPVRVKIDPGSKITGLAVVVDTAKVPTVMFAAELEHRGQRIKAVLEARSMIRQSRRNRKTRYRAPRFDNRIRKPDWLPPSLESRVANITTWVAKFRRYCPTLAISMELVRFDLQKMVNPEISGVAYQQGSLCGYEVREYLLEKWGRKCAYCGKENVPLQVEHIQPRSKGGTDRISNLAIACGPCNTRKGNRPIDDFLKAKPNLLAKIKRQASASLKDATAVNTTRWALFGRLKATGLPVECGSGGRTKFNRSTQGYPKAHWIDAACVGVSGESVRLDGGASFLAIKAMGHGKRNRCGTDRYGFPIRHAPRSKTFLGFQTGDIGRAVIPFGKYQGVHVGRITIRFRPCFQLNGIDVHPNRIARIYRADGYDYAIGDKILIGTRSEGGNSPVA